MPHPDKPVDATPAMRQSFLVRAPGRLLIVATLALLTLIWGTTWAAIRVALVGVPPFTGATLRFAVAALLLIVFARLLRVSLRPASRRELALWLTHAALSFCVSYGVVFWAEQWVPSGLAAVLFATFPLLVAVMAHFWLPGERFTPLSLAGTALGFVGIAVIYAEDFGLLGGPQVARAAVVMLLSPIAASVSNVAIKRWGDDLHPVSLNAAAMAIGTGIMAAVVLATERHRTVTFDAATVTALLYLAVMGSAVTFTLYFWLLHYMEARQLALLGYTIPIVALVVGWLWMDEPMTSRTLLGSALVVFGVALASRVGRPRAGPPEPEGFTSQ
jgi:drug/metabolite transporter (DMT)-like permease